MSGKRYRFFINTLVRAVENPRYLEIGSWAGSTLCAAIAGNALKAVAIDNWSEFDGPKATFVRNVRGFVTPQSRAIFLESDFRKVDYNDMGDGFNIYLFDGPHQQQDHYDALALVLPCLDDEFIYIVDDWNWLPVRAGTFAAIDECHLLILYSAEIRTTLDNSQPEFVGNHSDWHNGYFIAVLAKSRPEPQLNPEPKPQIQPQPQTDSDRKDAPTARKRHATKKQAVTKRATPQKAKRTRGDKRVSRSR
jgi:hypothetical protein